MAVRDRREATCRLRGSSATTSSTRLRLPRTSPQAAGHPVRSRRLPRRRPAARPCQAASRSPSGCSGRTRGAPGRCSLGRASCSCRARWTGVASGCLSLPGAAPGDGPIVGVQVRAVPVVELGRRERLASLEARARSRAPGAEPGQRLAPHLDDIGPAGRRAVVVGRVLGPPSRSGRDGVAASLWPRVGEVVGAQDGCRSGCSRLAKTCSSSRGSSGIPRSRPRRASTGTSNLRCCAGRQIEWTS
jgi:hypothetical protein